MLLILPLLLLLAVPVSLVRPYIGVLAFAWLSLMNPHRLTFGFAYGVSWAQYVAIATLIGFIVSTQKDVADSFVRYRIALAFLAWFVFAPQCISTIAVTRRETNGWKWPAFMVGYLFVLAYVAAGATYWTAVALGL